MSAEHNRRAHEMRDTVVEAMKTDVFKARGAAVLGEHPDRFKATLSPGNGRLIVCRPVLGSLPPLASPGGFHAQSRTYLNNMARSRAGGLVVVSSLPASGKSTTANSLNAHLLNSCGGLSVISDPDYEFVTEPVILQGIGRTIPVTALSPAYIGLIQAFSPSFAVVADLYGPYQAQLATELALAGVLVITIRWLAAPVHSFRRPVAPFSVSRMKPSADGEERCSS